MRNFKFGGLGKSAIWVVQIRNSFWSEPREDEVAVNVLKAVAPEEYSVSSRNLPDPLRHEAEHLLKMPEKLAKDHLYLLLSCFHFPRVDVCSLEVGEEKLHRGGIIAVGPSEDHRNLEIS